MATSLVPSRGGVFEASSTGNPINRRGLVAGWTRVRGVDRAAVFDTRNNAIHVLGTLGGASSRASDVNKWGDVAGWADVASGEPHAFLWKASTRKMRDLGTLGGASSGAASLNDHGTVVGTSFTRGGEQHAFVWRSRHQRMRDLGTLGGSYSFAYSVNNRGDIVGQAENPAFLSRAFLVRARSDHMRDIGLLPGTYSALARDVNDKGEIVGECWDVDIEGVYRPFVWSPSRRTMRALPATRGFNIASAINGSGAVVGQVLPGSGSTLQRAVVWPRRGAPATTLPAANDAGATAINGSGRIIGYVTGRGPVRWDKASRK